MVAIHIKRVVQVVTYGEPRPEVHWRFEEQPIYTSETIKTEEYVRFRISSILPKFSLVEKDVELRHFRSNLC